MDLQLRDKIVLVTGSSSGLGRATAALFAQQGARIVVNYLSDREGAEKTAARVTSVGGKTTIIQADISSRPSAEALVERVRQEWGPIHILVNNASHFEGSVPIEDLDEGRLRRMLDVAVGGTIHITAACVQGMKGAGWGRIVNVTSRSALMGAEGMSHYAAAKAALLGLTRAWAKELGPAGILVNAVAPTVIMTEAMLGSMPERVQEGMARRNPLRRLATPDDVARVILYLGSGWNTYVNGEIVTVGGGAMS